MKNYVHTGVLMLEDIIKEYSNAKDKYENVTLKNYNLFLEKYKNDVIVLFVMGMVICSILEYITSYILEKTTDSPLSFNPLTTTTVSRNVTTIATLLFKDANKSSDIDAVLPIKSTNNSPILFLTSK